MAERPRYRRRFRPTLEDERPLGAETAADVMDHDRETREDRADATNGAAPKSEASPPDADLESGGSRISEADTAKAAFSEDETTQKTFAPEEPERARQHAPKEPETLTLEEPIGSPAKDQPSARDAWEKLYLAPINRRHLEGQKIVTASRTDPAHAEFDVLRTRLLQALAENGWRRVAITSPTQGCGKTFTAANLAISLARQENCRTILFDCDMRRPALAETLGIDEPGAIGDMLRGRTPPSQHLLRLGENDIHAGHNTAFALNDTVEPYAAELLQDPRCVRILDDIEKTYRPDVMLFDLPPALYYDDVIAMRPLFDGILMVVGGGLTTPREMKEVERRLGVQTPLLGTVLNKAEGTELDRYSY